MWSSRINLMWSYAKINCATGNKWNSCVIVSFIVRSHPPWQYDNNMGGCICLYVATVLGLTSDWVAVLWIWLEDCVCVCVHVYVAASRAHHRSHSRLKPNQSQTQPWFLWSHVPMGPLLVCTQYRLPVLHSFLCACVSAFVCMGVRVLH